MLIGPNAFYFVLHLKYMSIMIIKIMNEYSFIFLYNKIEALLF